MRADLLRGGLAATVLTLVAINAETTVAQRVAETEDGEGTLIQIGPDRGAADTQRGRLRRPGFRESRQAISRYWIGVAGGPTPPEVRAHIDVDDGVGVILQTVQPDSPAEEGGLKPYDVVTEVNGDPVSDMRQLANAVGDAGERKGRLTLQLIRGGRPQTLWVTPAERPVSPAPPARGGGWFRGPGGGQPFGFGDLPGGLSIGVTQSGDEPAKITVRRGEETWELDANDAAAIAALPDDVRPFVERAVSGQPAVGGLREFLDRPDLRERFGLDFEERFPEFGPGDLQRRMQEMEEQVELLRRRFGVEEPPAGEPEPDDVEIPAES